jgi:hypothetical protein
MPVKSSHQRSRSRQDQEYDSKEILEPELEPEDELVGLIRADELVDPDTGMEFQGEMDQDEMDHKYDSDREVELMNSNDFHPDPVDVTVDIDLQLAPSLTNFHISGPDSQELEDEIEEEKADEADEIESMPPEVVVDPASSDSVSLIPYFSSPPPPPALLYPNLPLPPPPNSTLVSACASLLDVQTRHMASNAMMKDLFDLLSSRILPPGHILPSYYQAKEMVKRAVPYTVQYKEIHACINDCRLYHDDQDAFCTVQLCYECHGCKGCPASKKTQAERDKERLKNNRNITAITGKCWGGPSRSCTCPLKDRSQPCACPGKRKRKLCREPRFTKPLEQSPKDLPSSDREKLRPRKVFYSASIASHLRSLFADPETALALGRAWEYAKERSSGLAKIDTDPQYEPVAPSSNPDIDAKWTEEQRRKAKETQRDIWDSLMWKKRVLDSGFLSASEPLNVVMALSTDGVNPFGRRSVHSTWPIVGILYNYAPEVRSKFNRLLLLGLIPGPKEPANMKPYLDVIVQEINELYKNGVQVWDGYAKINRTVRVQLILVLGDGPAMSKMLNMKLGNAHAGCIQCDHKGVSQHKRTVFIGYKEYPYQNSRDKEKLKLMLGQKLRSAESLRKAAEESDLANYQNIRSNSVNHPSKLTGKLGSSAFDQLVMEERKTGEKRGFDISMAPPEPMHMIETLMPRLIQIFQGLREPIN